ncbi:OmpA family protein [Parapedobacter sp. 10938]|uniref:OmpA family protein n=1 Tax=Parapedobacter flavus TaxID=3110225 RepID=UPI002DB889D0|nr:OmpA family protein [Parapedobacter sp. 10938]MEC3878746.1 OmpA family protein [Parapedobacter sp. 10938]
MKTINSCLIAVCASAIAISTHSCKPKQVVVQPAAEVVEREAPAERVVSETPKEAPKEAPTTVKPVATTPPNYDFKNILFEYDSHVLKTNSYAILDHVSREMRKNTNAEFIIDGHASIEGTAEYNMELSIDRANAVKLYLVNSGIPADNLTVKGYGATRPAASNDTEAGRAQNRRVEIKHVD